MRDERLVAILNDLNGTSADIEASAIIATDGQVIASALPASMNEDRVGAMNAALLTLGDRCAQELGRGELEQVMVKGARGYIIMTYAGADALLSVFARSSAKPGLILLDAKRAAASIGQSL